MQDLIPLPPECYQDSDDDMKLRDDDKKWLITEITAQVTQAIDKAVDEFRPHGIAKAVFILRQLGPIAATIAVFVAVVFFGANQFNLANTRLAKQAAFETNTDDRLKHIETSLRALDSSFRAIHLQQLSDKPTSPQNIASAKEILKQAISNKIPIDQEVIRETGLPFVEAGGKSPDAWQAALAFLDYKSFLNSASLQILPPPQDRTTTDYDIQYPVGTEAPQFTVAGVVPKEQAAVFILNGKDLNEGKPKGFQYIFAQDGNVLLDNTKL